MSDGPISLDRTAVEMQRLLKSSPQVCLACLSVTDSVKKHIDSLFYERVTDIATREAIRRAQGFCRYHARLVSAQGDALGTALIMRDVLINELRAIYAGEFARPPAVSRRVPRFFERDSSPERPPCPLCEVERGIEEQAVDSVLAGLPDAGFADTFRGSVGLCLPHFHLAFRRCRDESVWQVVLNTQRRTLESITLELGALALKSDYRHSSDTVGAEADSWRRALDLTSRWLDHRPG